LIEAATLPCLEIILRQMDEQAGFEVKNKEFPR
jgi:hypothetical protein